MNRAIVEGEDGYVRTDREANTLRKRESIPREIRVGQPTQKSALRGRSQEKVWNYAADQRDSSSSSSTSPILFFLSF